MSIEMIFSSRKFSENFIYALSVSIIITWVGFLASYAIFRSSSGLASVIVVSIMVVALTKYAFPGTPHVANKFSFRRIYSDNRKAVLTYMAVLIGVFVGYLMISWITVMMGLNPVMFLNEQLGPDLDSAGHAFTSNFFEQLLVNNWKVVAASFLLSMLIGRGGLFFVIWNASVWGSIIGLRASAAYFAFGFNPLLTLLGVAAIIAPHMLLEGISYVLASISGNVLGSSEPYSSKKVASYLYFYLVIIIVLWAMNFFMSALIVGLWLTIFNIIALLVLVGWMKVLFGDGKRMKLFSNYYYLFCIAATLFVIGAIVETLVVGNSSFLSQVYNAPQFVKLG